ncbi:ABC transporter substrate-binding protein [Turicibacter bilis]|uniref:ABC transporter substrate-binding protein n=1 Tax=Turicibacter bilis TaxID=2735723 RepID=A0A9Q9CPS0_9FIRM|nr:ABC transporter substrate-binding protein [Turicibacter bilis]MBS3196983.1 ABC transporter substrate-binding protein [Turicibacter bilis]MBS3199636.1 ABC transporter substrate-binding protein [Turicibacter bilis]UUF06497.1 ABC transporter substrate-binding protein [Turicibacter bilis]UUF07747.1 ABC transporter substrate-binding protein [Turicibacter bilis]
MKKVFTLLTCAFVLVLTACSGGDKEKLNVYNVGEYIDPEVIKIFEKEFDCKVNYEVYDSNETMYQKVKAGGTSYDVVFPSDYMVEKMENEGLLLPLDYSKIPNFEYISDEYKNLPYDPENLYTVPYFWGTVGILYDKTVVTEPVDSWSILWDEKYKGNIFMYDSQRDSLMVALKLLGYSMNTQNVDELEEAKQLLIEQSPLVYAYVTDTVIDGMIAGNAALAVVYSGDATYIMSENEDMEFVIPKEGSNMWVDAMVIPSTAQNVELAHEFINFMQRPDIAQMNTEYVMYSTPNTEALANVTDEEWTQNEAYSPSKELLSSLPMETFRDPGSFITEYDRIWTEVLATSNR